MSAQNPLSNFKICLGPPVKFIPMSTWKEVLLSSMRVTPRKAQCQIQWWWIPLSRDPDQRLWSPPRRSWPPLWVSLHWIVCCPLKLESFAGNDDSPLLPLLTFHPFWFMCTCARSRHISRTVIYLACSCPALHPWMPSFSSVRKGGLHEPANYNAFDSQSVMNKLP